MAKPRGCFPKLLLLIVIIGAAAAAVPLLPISPLKDAVELKLSDTLGRKVTIDSVRLSLITGPYLTLTGMTAQEDPDFGQSVFLKASEVRAELDLLQSLRTRQIVLDTITLRSPQIDLVKNPNGVWSWTTLGKRPSEQGTVSRLVSDAVTALSILSRAPGSSLSTQAFRKVKIDGASVKLKDYSGAKPLEVLYKNISLNASVTSNAGEDSGASRQARGELVLQSVADGEAERGELLDDHGVLAAEPGLRDAVAVEHLEVHAVKVEGVVHLGGVLDLPDLGRVVADPDCGVEGPHLSVDVEDRVLARRHGLGQDDLPDRRRKADCYRIHRSLGRRQGLRRGGDAVVVDPQQIERTGIGEVVAAVVIHGLQRRVGRA